MTLNAVLPTFNDRGIDTRYRRITTKWIEETTEPNQEIIDIPIGQTMASYKRVTVYVERDTNFIRNGNEKVFVFGGSSFAFDESSTPTTSIVIVEQGTRYYGIADY